MNPCIAIIDPATLSRIALGDILRDIFPTVELLSFPSMEDFIADCDRHFIHYFVSQDIVMAHIGEFETLKAETIVLCRGAGESFVEAGFKVMDVFLPEKELIAKILHLHRSGTPGPSEDSAYQRTAQLSLREKQVLALIVKGLYNKEIADALGISVATAIFHRNHICEKLGTRSVGKLTLLAVLSHIVEPDAI